MNYIRRDIETEVMRASTYAKAVLVTGARQVGKTAMLRHLSEEEGNNRRYVTLDDYNARKAARENPQTFLADHPEPVLIDEIQYAPELFSYIKIAIDNGAAAGSFWMTGSQSYRLMKLAGESLAGRVALMEMDPLSQHETYGSGDNEPFLLEPDALRRRRATHSFADKKEIYARIWRGGMPAYVSGEWPDRDRFYASYLQTYMERDVTDVIPAVDRVRFADFVRAAACRDGQILNIHSIAADVDISDSTARNWLNILELSKVIYYLHPYSNNLLKRMVKSKKMYFFDTGLVAYLCKQRTAEELESGALSGAILENYVINEYLKTFHNSGREETVWYLRDSNGREIDLLAMEDLKLCPMEIKAAADPGSRAVKNFAVLEGTGTEVGQRAVLCNCDALYEFGDYVQVPIWMI